MLTFQNFVRLLFAFIIVGFLSFSLEAQTSKPKKQRKEKTKKVKSNRSNQPIASTTNQYNDDLRRFILNFNNSYKNSRDLANKYRLTRVLMEDQIRDLEAVEPVNKAKIVQIETRIKALKKQEKVAQSNLKKFKKYSASLANIDELSLSKQRKLVASIEAGYQKMPRVFDPPTVTPLGTNERPVVNVTSPNRAVVTKKKKSTRQTSVPTSISGYAKYERSKDVMFNPPEPDCAYRFKGIDEFLGKEKTELEPQQFFFHTDPELRQYMKGQEYINCIAGLATSTGGLTTLNIEVTIRSQNAQREFGGLQKGNPLTIRLVNGEIVKLLSVNSDNGSFDQTSGLTIFRNQFLVQKGEEKMFMESEIDKVRLVWSNGYEDYDVYNVDFLMNQLNCLYNN